MSNYDSDKECKGGVESFSEVNSGEEASVSDVVPVPGELSTGSDVTSGWEFFQ